MFYSKSRYYTTSNFINHTVKAVRSAYNFPEAASDNMLSIVDMYQYTCITISYILLAILLTLFLIIYFFSAEKNQSPFHLETYTENMIDAMVVFLPCIIIYYLIVPAVGYLFHLDRILQETQTLFTIEVIGHQWYWSYYMDILYNDFYDFFHIVTSNSILNFFSNPRLNLTLENFKLEFDQLMDLDSPIEQRYLAVNEVLVLPILENIKVLLTSEDVIHSWSLPQLGIKVDAIPGRIQSFLLNSFACGIYYGQCSELCGVNHAFMPICIEFTYDFLFFHWYMTNFNIHPYLELLNDNIIIYKDKIDTIEGKIQLKSKVELEHTSSLESKTQVENKIKPELNPNNEKLSRIQNQKIIIDKYNLYKSSILNNDPDFKKIIIIEPCLLEKKYSNYQNEKIIKD